jgi:hypothetical protein
VAVSRVGRDAAGDQEIFADMKLRFPGLIDQNWAELAVPGRVRRSPPVKLPTGGASRAVLEYGWASPQKDARNGAPDYHF